MTTQHVYVYVVTTTTTKSNVWRNSNKFASVSFDLEHNQVLAVITLFWYFSLSYNDVFTPTSHGWFQLFVYWCGSNWYLQIVGYIYHLLTVYIYCFIISFCFCEHPFIFIWLISFLIDEILHSKVVSYQLGYKVHGKAGGCTIVVPGCFAGYTWLFAK